MERTEINSHFFLSPNKRLTGSGEGPKAPNFEETLMTPTPDTLHQGPSSLNNPPWPVDTQSISPEQQVTTKQ